MNAPSDLGFVLSSAVVDPPHPPSAPTLVGMSSVPPSIPLGRLRVHPVSLGDAVHHIVTLVEAGRGGYVVTPNVDHVCLVEQDRELRDVYEGASLVLTDGKPLVWMLRAFGTPVPQKVSGSDVTLPLLRALRDEGRSVFLLGSTDDVCRRLVTKLAEIVPGLRVSGTASPMFNPAGDATEFEAALDSAVATKPDVLLFALGSPKQEYALGRYRERYAPTVAMGVGATFDFLVGEQKRPPRWVSEAGIEWAYRLLCDPKRLWRRYLVRDRKIVGIAWRQWRSIRNARSAD